MTKETSIFELIGIIDMKRTPISRGHRDGAARGIVLGLAASTARAADEHDQGWRSAFSSPAPWQSARPFLKDTVLMLIDGPEQERAGFSAGSLSLSSSIRRPIGMHVRREGRRVARARKRSRCVFGCWTSLSRKAVLPIFEQNERAALFYPVQYEGEESSRNIFYPGAAPSQQAIPAVRYLMSKEGGNVRRWVLLGTDYLYPRKTNQILSAYLASPGCGTADDITTIYASPSAIRLARDCPRREGPSPRPERRLP